LVDEFAPLSFVVVDGPRPQIPDAADEGFEVLWAAVAPVDAVAGPGTVLQAGAALQLAAVFQADAGLQTVPALQAFVAVNVLGPSAAAKQSVVLIIVTVLVRMLWLPPWFQFH